MGQEVCVHAVRRSQKWTAADNLQPTHPKPDRLLEWGVLLPLVAWPALLMPPGSSLVILALMLMASYAIDRRIYPLHGAGRWLTLRFRLSAVAALSCLLAAAGS